MNTTLSAPTSLHEHPPQQAELTHPVRRVGLLDRLALRLGLALLVWARRPVRARRLARASQTERYITDAEVAELREARYSSYHLLTLIR